MKKIFALVITLTLAMLAISTIPASAGWKGKLGNYSSEKHECRQDHGNRDHYGHQFTIPVFRPWGSGGYHHYGYERRCCIDYGQRRPIVELTFVRQNIQPPPITAQTPEPVEATPIPPPAPIQYQSITVVNTVNIDSESTQPNDRFVSFCYLLALIVGIGLLGCILLICFVGIFR